MVRMIIRQESANYRIPTIGNPILSYPLVPPSTVYGFLREITGKSSINYQNTRLSIQGYYEGLSLEIERLYVIAKSSESKTNIIKIQKLHQLTTVIHIKSSDEIEQRILDGIGVYSGGLRLGRREDLIIDLDIRRVDEKSGKIALYDQKNPYIYIPFSQGTKTEGNLFRLVYDTTVDDNQNINGREWINLLYLPIESMDNIQNNDGHYYYYLIN